MSAKLTDAVGNPTEPIIVDLQQEIDRFKPILSYTRDYIVLMDDQFVYQAVSKSFCDLLQMQEEQLLGATDYDVFPVNDADIYRQSDIEVIRSRKRHIYHRSITSAANSHRELEVTKTPFFNEKDQPAGILVCAHDITEYKRKEKELELKTQLLQAQSEASLDGILVVDDQDQVISFDQQMKRMWKVPQELWETGDDKILLVHSLLQLKSPEKFLEKLEYLRTHKDKKSRDELALKDGRYFERYSSPLLGSNHEYQGRVWYFRDITDRKKSEEALNNHRNELEELAETRKTELREKNQRLEREVIERINTERALRKSEEQYRTLYEDNPSMYFTLDAMGTVLSVNLHGARQLGYSAEELIGQPVLKVIAREDQPKVIEQLQRVLDKPGELHRWQFRKICKNGDMMWVEEYGRATADTNGDLNVLIVCQDITDRKQTEEKIKFTEARYRRLFEEAPVMYVITSSNNGVSVITDCNELFLVSLGYQREEVITRPLTDFCAGTSQIGLPGEVTYPDVRQNNFAVEDCDLATRTGAVIHTLLRAIPEKNAQGAVVGTWAMFVDVTEQRQAQQKIRSLQQFYETILDNIPVQIAVYDVSGYYLYVNPACVRDPELRQWLIGKNDPEYCQRRNLPAEIAANRRTTIETAVEEKISVTIEEEFPSRNDGIRNMIRTFSPIVNADGEVTHIIGYSADVTDERRREAQMQHTQKLESIGVLAGGIAHDFNNLLTGIIGNACLVLEDIAQESEIATRVATIEDAAHRAADLCQQLLAYSGKASFRKERLNINNIVKQTINLLRLSISKAVILEHHFANGLPAVEADATQIRQVVMNLITNASDAIGDNETGTIQLATGVEKLDEQKLKETYLANNLPVGHYVFIEVADTGCGMDPETLLKIFDPFFTTKASGRGLGLAALLGIVRGHGGGIDVQSQPGNGTTIRILLPCSKGNAGTVVRDTQPGRLWRGQGMALVVDDEEEVRSVAQTILEKAGFDVLTASDGLEALEIFSENREALKFVLMDLTMPRMNGRDALIRIQKLRPDVPVLLSSGYDELDIINQFVDNGPVKFIQKPYRSSGLVSKVRELLT